MGKEKKSVKRLNVEKSRNSNKFDSVRQIDFRLWVPGFMAKAAASECLKFFEGTEELTFDEQRPCAYGEEDQYVTNQVNSQKAVIRKAYKKNVIKISKSRIVPSGERLRMILNLDLEKNKEIARIKNSKDKIAKDLETSIVIFEKKERTFKVNQASAVNLMFESLGPNCLDEIKDLLTEKKPWAAWNKLKERFDSSKGGSANTASILDEIKDYTIEKKNGSITASIHYLKALGQEYDAAGSGKMDANLIFTFLLDAMSRSGLEEFKDLVHDARKPGSNYNLNMFEEHVSIIENRTAYDHTKEKGEKKGTSNSAFQNTLKNLNSAEQLMSLLAKVNHTKKPGKTPASNSANSAVVCSTCNRAGHTSEKCWKNHICTICNKKGHTERYCHLSKENNKSDKKFKVGNFTKKS